MVLQPHNCRNNYGLGYSAFARHYLRNHFCFLLLRLLRCFSSAGLPPIGYYVFNIVGCPIRISTDQFVCANPRSFSQLITSFFASESLGIPHTPLFCLLFSFLLLLVNIFIINTLCAVLIRVLSTCLYVYLNMSMYVFPFQESWRISESNR